MGIQYPLVIYVFHILIAWQWQVSLLRVLKFNIIILDRIRDNLGDKLQWIHLLTRKDINNIDKIYGLKGPENTKMMLHMWVEEMKSMNDRSPVILYKPQGTTQSSESNNLCGLQMP